MAHGCRTPVHRRGPTIIFGVQPAATCGWCPDNRRRLTNAAPPSASKSGDLFDAAFFREQLPQEISRKDTEGIDAPTVIVRLDSGVSYHVASLGEISGGWIVLEVYPERETPRRHNADDRHGGAPQFDLDRVVVAYEHVTVVVVTRERQPQSKASGCRLRDASRS
jgi:hypothetical protein